MNDEMRNRDWCEKNCGYFTTCSFGGICNPVMNYVRNQTPAPPLIEENAAGKKFYYCPSCEYEFFTYHNYCPDCGHAINWDGIRIKTSDIIRRKKMNDIKRETVIFQIKDMLFRSNRERIEEFGAFFENGHDFLELMENVLELLEEQDNCENCVIAIEDRQPVVRCKECKYWRQLYGDRPFYSSIGCCDCDDMWRSLDGETTEVDDIKTDSDFYCGYAERR